MLKKMTIKKWFIIPALTLVMIISMTGTAFAGGYCLAQIYHTESLVIGEGATMSGTVDRTLVLSYSADATYLTSYLKYDGYNWNDSERVYKGTDYEDTDLGSSKYVNPVLENYWGGDNPSSHKVAYYN